MPTEGEQLVPFDPPGGSCPYYMQGLGICKISDFNSMINNTDYYAWIYRHNAYKTKEYRQVFVALCYKLSLNQPFSMDESLILKQKKRLDCYRARRKEFMHSHGKPNMIRSNKNKLSVRLVHG